MFEHHLLGMDLQKFMTKRNLIIGGGVAAVLVIFILGLSLGLSGSVVDQKTSLQRAQDILKLYPIVDG